MHLGSAGQRARGERGFEHIHAGERFAIWPVQQQAFDVAHDVHHMAVTLHHKRLSHFDAACFGDAADVVTGEVNQHDVLCALFGVVDQLDLCRLVRLRRRAAWTGARQRPNGDLLTLRRGLLAHQNLGRSTHHVGVAEVVVIHIRTGVQRTQRTVQRQRAGRELLVDALAHLHLHEVARSYQLFGA